MEFENAAGKIWMILENNHIFREKKEKNTFWEQIKNCSLLITCFIQCPTLIFRLKVFLHIVIK